LIACGRREECRRDGRRTIQQYESGSKNMMQTDKATPELFTALAAAQAEIENAAKNAEATALLPIAASLMPVDRRTGRRRNGETLAERFYRRVVFGLSECWYWRDVRPGGYGSCHLLGEVFAHRVSWRLHSGEIPEGLHVLHRCDVRNCVNPDHLFLGTKQDNARDMVAKGRQPRGFKKPNHMQRGELHPRAKLSSADVADVRSALANGESGAAIARRYGVSRGAIYHIANGRNWQG
jgi:hypothetical protein